MKGIEYVVLRCGFFFFYAAVTSPIPIVCTLVMGYFDAHEHVRFLKWVCLSGVLVWFFGLPWLANRTAEHMAFEDRSFGVAVKLAFWDLRTAMGPTMPTAIGRPESRQLTIQRLARRTVFFVLSANLPSPGHGFPALPNAPACRGRDVHGAGKTLADKEEGDCGGLVQIGNAVGGDFDEKASSF
jgi:hypothetical protein